MAHIYMLKVAKLAKQIHNKLKCSIFSEKENLHLSDNKNTGPCTSRSHMVISTE